MTTSDYCFVFCILGIALGYFFHELLDIIAINDYLLKIKGGKKNGNF